MAEKYDCNCGSSVANNRRAIEQHKKTTKHMNFLKGISVKDHSGLSQSEKRKIYNERYRKKQKSQLIDFEIRKIENINNSIINLVNREINEFKYGVSVLIDETDRLINMLDRSLLGEKENNRINSIQREQERIRSRIHDTEVFGDRVFKIEGGRPYLVENGGRSKTLVITAEEHEQEKQEIMKELMEEKQIPQIDKAEFAIIDKINEMKFSKDTKKYGDCHESILRVIKYIIINSNAEYNLNNLYREVANNCEASKVRVYFFKMFEEFIDDENVYNAITMMMPKELVNMFETDPVYKLFRDHWEAGKFNEKTIKAIIDEMKKEIEDKKHQKFKEDFRTQEEWFFYFVRTVYNKLRQPLSETSFLATLSDFLQTDDKECNEMKVEMNKTLKRDCDVYEIFRDYIKTSFLTKESIEFIMNNPRPY